MRVCQNYRYGRDKLSVKTIKGQKADSRRLVAFRGVKVLIQRQNPGGFLTEGEVRASVVEFFSQTGYLGKRLLLIIPDNTRSGPVGCVFKAIYDCVGRVAAFDILVALGTHQPMSEADICRRLDISLRQRRLRYSNIRFFNHAWQRPDTFVSIGKIAAGDIEELTGGLFSEEVDVSINRLIFDYDEVFILGPVFPHEVVGFSGGHKYIFPGIAGPEIINFFHWLGAVITNPVINGNKWTAPRRVVERAASFIGVPRRLFALVAIGNRLKGIFIGDCLRAWEAAADLSAECHIVYSNRSYVTVLGLAPKMYDDIWTAGKVMYKLEPVVADGGTLIIYAPHIVELSYTHGEVIDAIGYHTRDYFLAQWDRFRAFPRGVLAHSTHVKGIGTYTGGVEEPRVSVVLATGILQDHCQRVNLGYMDPAKIRIEDYTGKEGQGILVVEHAGEMLYRLSDGTVPTVH